MASVRGEGHARLQGTRSVSIDGEVFEFWTALGEHTMITRDRLV